MKLARRIIGFIFSIYAFAVFLLIMFLVFPFVIMASFLGNETGGNIIYILCRFWSATCLFLWGIRHKNIYEAPHDATHPCIFLFNHISYMDIPILMMAFHHQHIRVLGKIEMTKIPIFGFIYRHAVVTVDRSDAAHRAKSVLRLKAMLHKNISIVLAPEGTFNMTPAPLKEFYDGAFKIAIETQTPIKPVVFLDAYDRLHYKSIFSMTPGKSRAVYLPEISVAGLTISDTAVLKQKVYNAMEASLIKYKASWIK
ncbi:MAG: 1-acyl-sn-glycerol-3-phosphate acyltransferase [Chitinophagaceae bacterium]|nr:MAG: 1-acyl-sn-glycerol-3-phosphate acyltransferase [Chitinophagaceae bacterium]